MVQITQNKVLKYKACGTIILIIYESDLLINNLKDNFGETLIPVKLLLTVVKMSRDPFVNTSFCLHQSILYE